MEEEALSQRQFRALRTYPEGSRKGLPENFKCQYFFTWIRLSISLVYQVDIQTICLFSNFLISDSDFVFSSRSLLSGIFPPLFCVLALYFRLTPRGNSSFFWFLCVPFGRWWMPPSSFSFMPCLPPGVYTSNGWGQLSQEQVSRGYQRGFLTTLRGFF